MRHYSQQVWRPDGAARDTKLLLSGLQNTLKLQVLWSFGWQLSCRVFQIQLELPSSRYSLDVARRHGKPQQLGVHLTAGRVLPAW